MSFWEKQHGDPRWGRIWTVIVMSFTLLILVLMAGLPRYSVWQKGMSGQAQLREAEYNRQIKVREAAATRESAVELALAEIERAKGVAEANRIIGESLQGNESYIRYLWVQGLNDGSSEVIYIPTEANLPILEARRLPR